METAQQIARLLLAYCLPLPPAEQIFESSIGTRGDRKCLNAQTRTGSMPDDGSILLTIPLTYEVTNAIP